MSDEVAYGGMAKGRAAAPPGARAASYSRGSKARSIFRLEHRGEKIASRRVFAARVSLAVLVWMAAATLSLAVGIAGYAAFERMPLADAFVSAAMVLSGMGEAVSLKTTGGKVFAGFFALFSGLFMLVATGVVLAPIIHRILHRFHVGDTQR